MPLTGGQIIWATDWILITKIDTVFNNNDDSSHKDLNYVNYLKYNWLQLDWNMIHKQKHKDFFFNIMIKKVGEKHYYFSK